MTPFAMIFMLVSMTAVTALAGYCMFRILGGGPPTPVDSSDSDD